MTSDSRRRSWSDGDDASDRPPHRRRCVAPRRAVVVAVLAPWIAPHDPEAIDSTQLLKAPLAGSTRSATDALGRDVLSAACSTPSASRCWWPSASIALAAVVGVPLGLVAGYRGGWVDLVVMRAARADPRAPGPAARDQPHRRARNGHAHHGRRHRRHLLPDPRPGDALGGAGGHHPALRRRVAGPRDAVARAIAVGHVLPNAIGPVLVQGSGADGLRDADRGGAVVPRASAPSRRRRASG